ncbi:unnamed protein product, partial [Amoebophrya sp. A25]
RTIKDKRNSAEVATQMVRLLLSVDTTDGAAVDVFGRSAMHLCECVNPVRYNKAIRLLLDWYERRGMRWELGGEGRARAAQEQVHLIHHSVLDEEPKIVTRVPGGYGREAFGGRIENT